MTDESMEVDKELMGFLAEDALSVFRINLVLIGLYTSALGLFSQGAGQEMVADILNADYTFFGIFAWFGSLTSAIFYYRKCRRLQTEAEQPDNGIISSDKITVNLVSSSAVASLLSVILLITGILEGFAGNTPPIAFPSFFVLVGILIWVMWPFILLTSIDWVAERWKIARDFFYTFI